MKKKKKTKSKECKSKNFVVKQIYNIYVECRKKGISDDYVAYLGMMINGRVLSGLVSEDKFIDLINELLEGT